MRNISLSDLTVAQAGGHTVISIGDHLEHVGPVVGIFYEKARDLSGLGFSRRQVACIMKISEQEVGQLATGNRPYPEMFQMQASKPQRNQPVRVTQPKARQSGSQTHQVNNDPLWFAIAAQDDTPHSRHSDNHHTPSHSPSPSYDSPSYDSGSSGDGGGGGGGD